MRDSISRIAVLTGRNLKEIIRDPLSLVFAIALPLVMEILFYFIFHSLTTQFEMKYLAPGIVVFAESFLTLFTGILISTDRNTSFLTRLYVSKARSHEFIFSYALSILPVSLFQAVLFFVVGGIFDASLFGVGMICATALSLVTSLFFIAAGILFGSVCSEKSVGGISSVIIAGQSVLSGMWFPIEGLNEVMVTIMKVLPFKNATMLIQNTVLGFNDVVNDFLIPLSVVLLYAAATFVLAIIFFKKKMRSE